MNGKEILQKYPVEKFRTSSSLFGPWILHNATFGDENDLIPLTFVREVALIIESDFLDPWGRKFPKAVPPPTRFHIKTFSKKSKTVLRRCEEHLLYTTVEGNNIRCGVLMNPNLFSNGSIIQLYKYWSWL